MTGRTIEILISDESDDSNRPNSLWSSKSIRSFYGKDINKNQIRLDLSLQCILFHCIFSGYIFERFHIFISYQPKNQD